MGRHSMKPFIRWTLLIALMLSESNASGDVFTEYLTGRDVRAIVADSGFVWFGTFGAGLVRFDGTRFTDYTTSNSLLQDNFIQSLAFDRDGNLWVGTRFKGAGYFNFKKNTFVFYDTSRGLVDNSVKSITVDGRGRVWFGTEGGVGVFDRMKWCRYTEQDYGCWDSDSLKWDIKTYKPGEKHLLSNEVNAVAADAAGTLWFGTPIGASRLNGENDWESFFRGSLVRAIFVDRRDAKWFGTDGFKNNMPDTSLYKLVGSGSPSVPKGINLVAECLKQRNTPTNPTDIRAINEDHAGILWVGTTRNGPFSLDPVSLNGRCFSGSAKLDLKLVQTIAPDRDGNLWFGSDNNRGATKYTANWISFTFTRDDIKNDEIFALTRNQRDQIWIGTRRGIARYDSSKWRSKSFFGGTATRDQITAIEVARDNTLWVGTSGAGVLHIKSDFSIIKQFTRMTTPGGLIDDNIRAIAIAHDSIWVGTLNGLTLFDVRDTTQIGYTTFTREKNTEGKLLTNQIDALAVDLQGRLWIGTAFGINRYDGTWTSFTTANTPQLRSNSITSITVDSSSGRVWFGTRGGAVNFLNGKWNSVTIDDGLVDDFVEDVLILNKQDKKQEIWFATAGGVSRFVDAATGRWTTYKTIDGLADNHITNLIEGAGEEEIWFGTFANGVTRYRRQKNFPNTAILDPIDFTTQPEVVFRFLGNDLNTAKDLLRYSHKLDNRPWSDYTFDTQATLNVTERGLHTFYVKTVDKDNNEDLYPASKSFYKVDPDTGSYTSFTDTSKVYSLDPIKITLYLPPNQLDDSLEVTITPVPRDSLKKPAELAYDFTPYQVAIDKKGVILTFEFLPSAAVQYSIHRDRNKEGRPDSTILNGTLTTTEKGFIRLSTGINQFGRYAVRPAGSSAPLRNQLAAVKFDAQPRIFSPNGSGHNQIGHGPLTNITFKLIKDANVTIKVYNLAGRYVDTICDRALSAGSNAVHWDGRDYRHQVCPSGLYILVLESDGFDGRPKPLKVMVLNE